MILPPRVALPLAALAAAFLSAPSVASVPHEDDPKVRDRQPAFRGSGYRPGALRRPGARTGAALLTGAGPTVAFDSQGVQLLSWVTLAELGGSTSGNDCWGYVSPSGREYALVGVSQGTAFVEITDPTDPVVVDFVPGPSSLWRDVKVYDRYAYAVSEGGDGIQVIDMANIDNGSVQHVNTVTSGGTTATHNVAIDTTSGFLYRTGGGTRGLRIYRLTNPANPVYVGQWNSRYVHDAQVVTFSSGPYAGRQIAFCCSGLNGGFADTGLTILDVTNKSNIVQLSQFSYPGPRYSHQAWLSADQQLLYLNDELDENGFLPTTTHIIDVSDLSAPASAGTFTNGSRAVGHNLYTLGDRIFEANYRSGLRIFDASDPLAPTEVAYFDVWPGDDYDAYNGLWSVYPYFPSGVVIGSDMEKGLFVWWPDEAPLSFGHPAGPPALLDPAGHTLEVQITELEAGALASGTARLVYDLGAGQVEVPLVDQGGGTYAASLPSLACGDLVQWYLTAETQAGLTWTDPPQAPYVPYESRAGFAEQVVLEDDVETSAAGWIVGHVDDDANEGFWLRGDPTATEAQPEDDHTPNGSLCWYTGFGSVDVDDGRTSLISPAFDLVGVPNPRISYWRWFSDREGLPSGSDRLTVHVSDDDGANWTLVETVNGNGGTSVGLWVPYSFAVEDFVTKSAEVRVRFTAFDVSGDSTVEAAIDDLRVVGVSCDCQTQSYCAAVPNSSGSAAVLSWSGSLSVSANGLVLSAGPMPPGQNGLMIYSPDAIGETPLGDGNLCVGTQTLGFVLRLPFEVSDAGGVMTHTVDLLSPPAPEGQVTPGTTWNFQAWFRDVPAAMAGFNFSTGLTITFCP